MTTILGLDISHYQQVGFPQVKASGRSFVVLKATESTNYIDPTFAARRAQAHAAGLIVGFYHFARAGNATAEAVWFLRTVGTLQPGEFLVLDWEVPAANPPAWCKQWLDTVYQATGVRPLIYMNSSAMTGSNWSPVAADYGLWLAKYDGSTAQPAVKWWAAAAMKQFSDKGSVPGVGLCDVDVFYGSEAQLLAYGKGGQPTPNVITPGVPDMRLARTPDGTVWAVTDTEVVAISDVNLFNAAAKVWGQPVDVTAADIQLLTNDCNSRPKLVGYGRRIEGVQNELQGTDQGTLNADLRADLSHKQQQLDALQTAVAALASGGVDPKTVIAGVLAGLNGAQLNVQQGKA